MSNVIAIIWDFDRTLIDGYMQAPIFEKYGVSAKEFWKEVDALPQKYQQEQNVKVNPDTIYLNQFIRYAKKGIFKGLNNQMLKDFGGNLKFYDGIPEIFKETRDLVKQNPKYEEFNIKVEHYIVSTGITQIIRGSVVNDFVEGIWGCEFIEEIDLDNPENTIISEIGFTIDNTTKTRAIFEINKGVNKREDIEVNTKVPKELRRVAFENMIYIADGPSDIPAFSVIKKNGGATFAVYPQNDRVAFRQVDRLIRERRVDMYSEANYSKGTPTYMWIMSKVEEIADRIYKGEKNSIRSSISEIPKHLL